MPNPVVPPWREPFERALDADPEDQRVRRDLADHLDELGDPDAEALRWLADHDRRPFFNSHRDHWCWGLSTDPGFLSHLPEVFWSLLAGDTKNADSTYATRRAAEADFCRAYWLARDLGWEPRPAPGN